MRAYSRLRSMILTVTGAAMLVGIPVLALDTAAAELSAEQRTQIEGVVHDYLINNPQVLKEALARLEKHQEAEQRSIVAKAVRSLTEDAKPEDGIIIGNPDADVTLVEFFDYNCGYCKKALSDIEALVKADPRIRFVIRDFPILRPESAQAALVSIAAGKQLSGEKYYRFHSDLLLSKGVVGKERALEVAKAAGVDMDRLQKDMESDAVRQVLTRTMQSAEQLSITGTPSFAVGDGVVPGAIGIETLQTLVGSVRQCGKLEC